MTPAEMGALRTAAMTDTPEIKELRAINSGSRPLDLEQAIYVARNFHALIAQLQAAQKCIRELTTENATLYGALAEKHEVIIDRFRASIEKALTDAKGTPAGQGDGDIE